MLERLTSLTRLLVGLAFVGLVVAAMMLALLPLLPWRVLRIRVTNHVCSFMGAGVVRIMGCPVELRGREHVSADRPALYLGNHTSILDAFTTIWLTPSGTVGVAKREVIYYPFYGLAWWLAGHLLLDRARTETAKARLRAAGAFVKDNGLHVCMMPEGTRSRDGRLLAFKKGFFHLAQQTRLPIVPMITTGAQRAWDRGSLRIRRVPIVIEFLPPISTAHWREDRMEEHIAELRQVFIDALPPAQRPLEVAQSKAA